MSWRKPTHEQEAAVQLRSDERGGLQKVIRRKREYEEDPGAFTNLPRDERTEFMYASIQADEAVREDPTLFYFPFDKQVEFHTHKKLSTIEMLICANRSGKTTPCAIEAAWWAMGVHPYIWTPPPPIVVWFVSVDNKFAKGVVKRMLDEYLPKGTIYHKQDMFYLLPNGSEVVLKSQEAGRTKFQGTSIPLIVWDEEGESEIDSEEIYKECRARMIDQAGMMIMCLTMIEYFQWIADLADRGENGDPNVALYGWTMRDNPHIHEAEIAEFEQDLTEEEALVRVYGRRVRIGIRSIFPSDVLLVWLEKTKERTYYNAELKEDLSTKRVGLVPSGEHTELRIFEWPEPWNENEKNEVEYILTGDPAGGDGGNNSAAIVLRRNPMRVCAVLRSNELSPKEFGRVLYKLGTAYWQMPLNMPALVAVEQNNHGHAVLVELENLGYQNLWKNKTPSGREASEAGWRNNPQTKPQMEGYILDVCRSSVLDVSDYRIVEELMSYRRDPRTNKTGASTGKQDDLVIALGIALYVHDSEPTEVLSISLPKNETLMNYKQDTPEAVWHDAMNADPWKEVELY